ncbi:MFS transporter [Bdellovibrio sp. NC01]|uniref:MFS transporter n=1 Tax=Bdellovibrio sp. NC01 TaxID=2220073 RepID=UPI00115B5509|nr:MFS transporter [Bdellovibrio sp. NC01]QDK36768.1 hypothetical protein DOE51_03715 [Bdellovibrio sp. NC01]
MEQPTSFARLWDKLATLCLVNLLSFYCFYLSGILYIESTTLFFNPASTGFASVSSLLSFFLGFLLRPIGALFFGFVGDTRGAKKSLVQSMGLLGVMTLGIGILPSFEKIGIVASLMNVFLRLGQGFAIGGTYSCSAILGYELAPEGAKGRYTSLLQLSVPAGYLAAMAIIVILKLMIGIEAFLSWGWRACFMLSILVLYFTFRLHRSDEFDQVHTERSTPAEYRDHLAGFLSNKIQLKNFFLMILPLMVGLGVVGYISNIYKLYFFQSVLKVDAPTVSFIIATSSLLYMPSYYLWGRRADRIGSETVLLHGLTLSLIFIFPLFMLLQYWVTHHAGAQARLGFSTLVMILISAGISSVAIIGYSPLIAYVCQRVPTALRCTLFSLVYNLGFGILSGIVHLMSGFLFEKYRWVFVGLWLMEIIGVICAVIILFYRRKMVTSDSRSAL